MKKSIPSAICNRQALFAALCMTSSALIAGCASQPWYGTTYMPSSNQSAPRERPVQAGYYRVNAGDTLASVAAAFGQAPQSIADWNRLSVSAPLVPGQIVRVAPPPMIAGAVPGNEPALRPAWPAYGQVVRSMQGGSSQGIVIQGTPSEPVKASADGIAIYVGPPVQQNSTYKTLVIVKHNEKLVTAYAMNGEVAVREGDVLKKGQLLGTMGADANGRATTEFEIRREGKPVDPQAFLPR